MTSASPFGENITPQASQLVEEFIIGDKLNTDLQWAEGSYRGFYLLTVSPSTVNATYWAMKDLTSLNLNAFPSVQFTVHSGESGDTEATQTSTADKGLQGQTNLLVPSEAVKHLRAPLRLEVPVLQVSAKLDMRHDRKRDLGRYTVMVVRWMSSTPALLSFFSRRAAGVSQVSAR